MKRQILLGLILLTILNVAPVLSQAETFVSENQCEMAPEKKIVGENISLNVVNTDIKDVLNFITEKFGCDFVVEDKVRKVAITLTVNNIPWNTALKTILETHNLDMMISKSSSEKNLIFIGTERRIYCERSGLCCDGVYPPEKDTEQLYSEFIKLKNLPNCPKDTKCEQPSIAFNRLMTYVSRRLTRNGQVEIDESSQAIIITDKRENLDSLIALISLIDNTGFYNEAEKDK